MALVVDASVAAKWVFAESHDEIVLRLVLSGERFAAPDLIWAELANIAWKRVRRAAIAPREAAEALAELRRLPIEVHAGGPLAEASLELALALEITCYDALYLALAERLDLPLVTADRRFFEAAAKRGSRRRALWIGDL